MESRVRELWRAAEAPTEPLKWEACLTCGISCSSHRSLHAFSVPYLHSLFSPASLGKVTPTRSHRLIFPAPLIIVRMPVVMVSALVWLPSWLVYFFFMVDIYFLQISSATDHKYLVMADLAFSAVWTFLWFIGFCVLTNQWSSMQPGDVLIGASSACVSITFSFFSIFSWGLLIAFALQHYRMGVQDFDQSYIDPAPGPTPPYSSYPNASHESYQQPPFTRTVGLRATSLHLCIDCYSLFKAAGRE